MKLSCWEIINNSDPLRLNKTQGLAVLQWTILVSSRKVEGDVLSLKSKGGSGKRYSPYISQQGAYSCNCADFKFRRNTGACKHVLSLAQVIVGEKEPHKGQS